MIGYRCIACETVQEQDFSGYVCPVCGSNLDIVYDYASLAPHFPAAAATASDIFDFSALLPVGHLARNADHLSAFLQPVYQLFGSILVATLIATVLVYVSRLTHRFLHGRVILPGGVPGRSTGRDGPPTHSTPR